MQTNTVSIQLGERIRSYRLQAGLTVAETARAIGIPVERLDAAERGENPLTPEQLVQLCTMLDRPPSDFLADLA